jgi:hypothetical protein
MPLGIWDKTFKKFPNASYLNIVKRLSDFLLISFLCKNKAKQQNVRPREVLSSRIIPCSYHLIMFPKQIVAHLIRLFTKPKKKLNAFKQTSIFGLFYFQNLVYKSTYTMGGLILN